MKNITITKENLLKAHSEGCDDTKKVLENLCPDEFEDKIKYHEHNIYACFKGGFIFKLHRVGIDSKDEWSWIDMDTSICYSTGRHDTPEEAILAQDKTIEVFYNQEDFFTWALKQIS